MSPDPIASHQTDKHEAEETNANVNANANANAKSPNLSKKLSTKELLQWARSAANIKLAAISGDSSTTSTSHSRADSRPENASILLGFESPLCRIPVSKAKLTRSSSTAAAGTSKDKEVESAPGILSGRSCHVCHERVSVGGGAFGGGRYFDCFRCKKSFCARHTPPVTNGVTFELKSPRGWMRVCELCFLDAKRPLHRLAPPRSLMSYFSIARADFQDFREIEAKRLSKRLEKIADYGLERDEAQVSSVESFAAWERRSIPWQTDSSSTVCTCCSVQFTALNRRHHCRLCGKLVCAACCTEHGIPLKLATAQSTRVRSCRKCHSTLFRKPHPRSLSLEPAGKRLLVLYRSFNALRAQILETIPQFNDYLIRLSDPDIPSSRLQQFRHDAWSLRDTLILVSLHLRSVYQDMAQVIRDDSEVLSSNLLRAGNAFIQRHMFTLQILADNKPLEKTSLPMVDPVPVEGSRNESLIRRLVPDSLLAAFNSPTGQDDPETASTSSLGIYDHEGHRLPLQANQSALATKAAALTEQRQQLQDMLEAATETEPEKTALSDALAHVELELKRLDFYINKR